MSLTTENNIEQSSTRNPVFEIVPKTDWKKIYGLQEKGVYYALFLLVTIIAVATTYIGQ